MLIMQRIAEYSQLRCLYVMLCGNGMCYDNMEIGKYALLKIRNHLKSLCNIMK